LSTAALRRFEDFSVLSELFLIDAEQLNSELQRFTQRERGASPASAASAADALADLLRTLELVAYASCARALARWLDQVKTPAQIGERRELTNELIGRLSEVILSLRSDKPTADDKLFATAWLDRLAPAKPLAPTAPAVPSLPAAQADLASVLPSAKLPAKLPANAPADALADAMHRAAAADADRAAADQRSTALAQARSLHEGLAQTPASSRAGIERVIAGLVAQARVGCEQLGGVVLPAALLAAPEALTALAAAVAALPAGHSLLATAAATVISVEIEGCQPSAYALAAVGQIIGQCGGRVDVLPDGLRLAVPRDPRRPMVVVLRSAQGWFALHSLQFEGLVGAAGVASDNKSGLAPTHLAAHSPAQPTGRISRPAAPARRLASLRIGAESLQLDLNIDDAAPEPSAAVWRYELPASDLWPMPAQWQAMVSDGSGRLMPLLLPVELKPMPAADTLPASAEDVPALPLAAAKRKPRRRAVATPVDPAQQAEPT